MARLERQTPGIMQLAGMGVELAGAVLGGCLLGYWIDRHFQTGPWGLVICASMGIVGGLYNMIRKAIDGPRKGGGAVTGRSGAGRVEAESGGGGEGRTEDGKGGERRQGPP